MKYFDFLSEGLILLPLLLSVDFFGQGKWRSGSRSNDMPSCKMGYESKFLTSQYL